MIKYIALLRAVNVGGHNIKMEMLRKYFEDLKLKNVETYIASGNVIFESNSTDTQMLEKKIESFLHKKLGYEVAVFIRTASELKNIVEYKSFNENELISAKALNVAFIKDPLNDESINKLKEFENNIDRFESNGREIYWLCKLKQSESKFSNAAFEKALKIKSTFRGINTIRKLSMKYPSK